MELVEALVVELVEEMDQPQLEHFHHYFILLERLVEHQIQ
jgi:hypothetical protein